MSKFLRPYNEYSVSPAEWLGELPSHWKTLRARYLFKEIDNRSQAGEETHLSMSQKLGLVPSKDMSERRLESESYKGGKLCQPGDLVLNRLKAHLGVFATSHYTGVISPDYTVLSPITQQVRAEYYELALKLPACRGELRTRTKGLVEGFWRLYTDDFYSIRLPVPPPDELDQILRFIRHLDQRVNQLIKTKRRLIELLNEQKQAIIHRAVTRGLDPTVPLKPSGIDWLREIPAYWTLRRLRHLVSERLSYGANEAAELTDETLPRYIRITDFSQDGSLRSETFRSLPRERAQDYMVYPGDILLARSGATVGKAFLVPEGTGEACHAGYLIKAMVRRDLMHPEYLFAFTQSRAYFDWKEATFNIATIQNIGADKYANLHVPTPGLLEQSAILAAIEQDSKPINEAISKLRSEIDFIREYRTRLVADVVTGQLDVRHLDLPEVEESHIEAIDADSPEDLELADEETED
jgi:type I restriction enzyme S subunit